MDGIGKYMSQNVIWGYSHETIRTIAQRMNDNKVGCVIIFDKENKLSGIITERDIITKIICQNKDPNQSYAYEAISNGLITAPSYLSVTKAASMMKKNHIKKLPIVDDGKLVGIITQTDLLKVLSL